MSNISLRPLTSNDIDAAANIGDLAFKTDRQTLFKAADPKNPYNHHEGTESALRHWLSASSGGTELTGAIDTATKELVGWVAWGFRGFNSPEAERKRREQLNGRKTPELNVESVRGDAPRPDLASLPKTSVKDALETYTSHDLQVAFMKTLMPPGVKCMYIVSIVVRPDWHSKGVGSALIRKGTDRADQEGICAWVHASEAGAGMFERCGFKEVRKLELNLDEWNWEGFVPPEGEEGKWGKYTFRYMLREPVGK